MELKQALLSADPGQNGTFPPYGSATKEAGSSMPKVDATLVTATSHLAGINSMTVCGYIYGDRKERFNDGTFVRSSIVQDTQVIAPMVSLVRTMNTTYLVVWAMEGGE